MFWNPENISNKTALDSSNLSLIFYYDWKCIWTLKSLDFSKYIPFFSILLNLRKKLGRKSLHQDFPKSSPYLWKYKSCLHYSCPLQDILLKLKVLLIINKILQVFPVRTQICTNYFIPHNIRIQIIRTRWYCLFSFTHGGQ